MGRICVVKLVISAFVFYRLNEKMAIDHCLCISIENESKYTNCLYLYFVAMPSFCAVKTHKSSNLQEYPHSLSYHAMTLISVLPTIMMAPTSKMEDRESPKQSDDTILSVQYPNTPFIGPSAAAFIAAHTAS